jgi:hypothetical protein
MSIALLTLALATVATAADAQPNCVVRGEKLVPTAQVSAQNLDWYVHDQPITLGKKRYVKYGFPQILGVDDLRYWMTKDQVPVMVKADLGDYRGVVYVQSSTTICEFQPYRLDEKPKIAKR